MFRKRRHIRAKPDEWIHVHRGQQQPMKRNMELGEIIGCGIGIVLAALMAWELIKALYPFLIIAGVIAAIVHFKKS